MGFDSYNPTVTARLSNASKTRVLNLKESSLHRIPDSVEKLSMIRHLDLSINYLSSIPAYFGNLIHLKQLHVARNQLETLPDELENLVNLELLDISQNKLTDLPSSLSKCTSLKTINGSENQFIVFPQVMCTIPNIETITMAGNRIEAIPDEIRSLKAISVFLNKNRLINLNFDNFTKCERLRVLNVDENQLCRDEIESFVLNAPGTLKISFEKNVSQLHTDDLQNMGNESSKSKSLGENARKIVGKSGPSTSTVNKHLEMASKSRILQLKGSGLKKVPEDIEQLAEVLRNLELSENKIREIPPFIGTFSCLKQLHLSNNCIEFLPYEIGQLKKLEILNLAGNKLKDIPDTIAGCTDLKNIDVSSNAFVKFPVVVFGIMQLEVINLCGNQIESIPDEISELRAMELNLNQNRLQSINASYLIKCPRLRTLRVEENCLEKSQFTKELLESSPISLIAYQGNMFQLKEFQNLSGYEAYEERYTATKRKI